MKKDFDKEISDLIMSERIGKIYKTGAIKEAISVYRQQAVDADIARQTAERKATRLETIETTVERYKGKAFEQYIRDIRNAKAREVAEAFRYQQAEREAVIAAIDEVLAIDEADEVLQDVSDALGIALPSDDAKAEICRRNEVGNANIQFNRLMKTLSIPKIEKPEPLSDEASEEERRQANCTDMRALTISEFNGDLDGLIRAAANFGRYSEDKLSGAEKYPDPCLQDELASIEWRLKHMTDLVSHLINRAYPVPDDVQLSPVLNDLDEEALESARQIVCNPWDAGLTSIGDMLTENDYEVHSRPVDDWVLVNGRLLPYYEDEDHAECPWVVYNVDCTVADMHWQKPADDDFIRRIAT